MCRLRQMLALQMLLVQLPIGSVHGIDNGVGVTPPMGWRHWKAFYAHINQDIMEEIMEEMAAKHLVDGVPTSLADLGYKYVGLDDHWQNCTTICPNGTVVPSYRVVHKSNGQTDYDYQGCVNATGGKVAGARQIPWYSDGTDSAQGPYGTPQWDTHRFPDVKGMVAKGHSLGLRPGWYMGNYQCSGANNQCVGGGKRGDNCSSWDMNKLVAGSVKALVDAGFDSVKLDSGFAVGHNLTLWAQLLNQSGRDVMIENCHQGALAPGLVQDGGWNHNCTGLGRADGNTDFSDCPFTFWRTTGDPYPDWGTIMRELNGLRKVKNKNYGVGTRGGSVPYNADPPRSRPGGWAYPGTMTLGDGGSVNASGVLNGGLTYDENAVHFGGWCIVSSPLILAYNLTEPARRELVWPIITNKEAIMVNQIWAGHPGSQVLANTGSNSQIEVWTKPLGGARTAVLIINTANKAEAIGHGVLDNGLEEVEQPWAALRSDPNSHFNSNSGRDKLDAGVLQLVQCNQSRPSQLWILSPGVASSSGAVTNVFPVDTANNGSEDSGQCWSVHACRTTPGSSVSLDPGCKKLPEPPFNPCPKACSCNCAWEFYSNKTIASAMTGQCLTAVGNPKSTSKTDAVQLETCKVDEGNDNDHGINVTQQWIVTKRNLPLPPQSNAASNQAGASVAYNIESVAQPGMCVDAAPPGPVIPPCIPPKCTPGAPAKATIKLSELGLGITQGAVKVRDVWNKKNLPDIAATGSFNTTVPHHGCTFFVFSKPGGEAWPPPFQVADWLAKPPTPAPAQLA